MKTHINPDFNAYVPHKIILAGLSPLAMYVYSILAMYADWDTGVCWPTQATIMQHTNTKRRETLVNAVRELVDAQFITTELKKCSNTKGKYGKVRYHYTLQTPARQAKTNARAARRRRYGTRYK